MKIDILAKKYYFLLFILLVTISCSRLERSKITPIIDSKKLEVSKILKIEQGCYNNILVKDSSLILMGECHKHFYI
jgi:hypothetical protein